MSPPDMAGWNLGLRFCLEVIALAGLASAAWQLTPGTARWVTAIAVPLTAAVAWGVFNVLDDPSRSGAAPIEVPGWARLVIEVLVFGTGSIAIAIANRPSFAVGFVALVVTHYAMSWSRVEWLLGA